MKINPQTKEEIRKLIKDRVNRNKQKVVVYSALELTGEQKNLLGRQLGLPKEQNVAYEIRPTLIAGVVVQVGSRVIDESVQGKLQNLHTIIYDAL